MGIRSKELNGFTDLNLGFTNAENYRLRSNKELLSKYFVRDDYLEKILDPNVYFLIGEKGTGKTAYSTYLRNNKYKNKNAFTYDIRQTEYQKFLELKRSGHLPLSQYSEVWRTLLLILCATSIAEAASTPAFLQRFTHLRAINSALAEFYQDAFSPEIAKVMDFLEASDVASALIAKHSGVEAKVNAGSKSEIRDSKTIFQTNLLSIRRSFERALSQINLREDYIIFIDGIDIRPPEIAYKDYFECVRGLIDSIWSLNTDFLANIKDSKGRIRVVVLVRPDIFLAAGLHNANTKIRDNSVYLDWQTSYKDYRTSRLFAVADRVLSSQQDVELKIGDAWDYYFPFSADNVGERLDQGLTSSFLSFLRFGYHRPRDINAMMGTMQQMLTRRGRVERASAADFNDPTFRDAHANYLLGEVRDQLLFYYTQDDYNLFILFFSHLNGKHKFSYEEYHRAFLNFIAECSNSKKELPKFFESQDVFLQFLYDQNVICYFESDEEDGSKKFIRWCFRERSPSNPSPKVRINTDYEIFYGLKKALNVGRVVKLRAPNKIRETGSIVKIFAKQGYGFIRGGNAQADHHFSLSKIKKGSGKIRVGAKVTYEPIVKNGKRRAEDIQIITEQL